MNQIKEQGHKYAFIDFEGFHLSLSVDEIDTLLSTHASGSQESKLVITLASRANIYSTKNKRRKLLVSEIFELGNSYENLSFCLVAGNKAYLSAQELETTSATNSLRDLALLQRKTTDRETFIGTEGVLSVATQLTTKFGFIPFLLKSEKTLREVEFLINRTNNEAKIAVYSPFSYGAKEEITANTLKGYISRRKETWDSLSKGEANTLLQKIQTDCSWEFFSQKERSLLLRRAQELALFGNENTLTAQIDLFKRSGVNILVALPLGISSLESTFLHALENQN